MSNLQEIRTRILQRFDGTLLSGAIKAILQAGEAAIGTVGGYTVPVQITLTRPGDTDIYLAKDCIADKTSGQSTIEFAGAGRIEGGTGYITGLQFETNQAANTSAYILYLFREDPAAIIADNAVWNSITADKAKRIIAIDIPACAKVGASGTTAISDVVDIKIPYKCADNSTSIKAQLKTVDGFTPANAQTFTITAIFDQN